MTNLNEDRMAQGESSHLRSTAARRGSGAAVSRTNSVPYMLTALFVGLAIPGAVFALAVRWMLDGHWAWGVLALGALFATLLVLAACVRSAQMSRERGE